MYLYPREESAEKREISCRRRAASQFARMERRKEKGDPEREVLRENKIEYPWIQVKGQKEQRREWRRGSVRKSLQYSSGAEGEKREMALSERDGGE